MVWAAVQRARRMDQDHNQIMTIEELAAYLKVSKSTLYKLVQAGKLPGQKVGKHWRFRRETIDKWLGEEHRSGQ